MLVVNSGNFARRAQAGEKILSQISARAIELYAPDVDPLDLETAHVGYPMMAASIGIHEPFPSRCEREQ